MEPEFSVFTLHDLLKILCRLYAKDLHYEGHILVKFYKSSSCAYTNWISSGSSVDTICATINTTRFDALYMSTSMWFDIIRTK